MVEGLPRLRFGKYEPLMELASGGMAKVYAARQVGAGGFERLVVVKRVHPHLLKNRVFYDMFRDEARLAALIRHPNVVTVTDVVEFEDELLLVMEYVEGAALSALLRGAKRAQERIPPNLVSRIVLDALAGLQAAHEARDMLGRQLNVVHRDVSPQNIIVSIEGVTRLIDFGVAKAAHRCGETQSGTLKGKLAYLSPEQVNGEPLDRRADVFAAGIVLHEALTGQRLFEGANEADCLMRVLQQDVPPPSKRTGDCPPALDSVVAMALTRNRDERFQTAAAFGAALEASCPPASPKQVADLVNRLVGESLADRRVALQSILEGDAAPMSARSPRELDLQSKSRAQAKSGTTTQASSDSNPEDMQNRSVSVALERSTPPPPPRGQRRNAPIAVAVALALCAALATVLALRGQRLRGDTPAAAASSAALFAATPATSVQDAAPVAADRLVVLVANSPIETVRGPGIKTIALEGARARLTLESWKGEIVLEATLTNGKVVQTIAQDSGPQELSLRAKQESAAGSRLHPILPPKHAPNTAAPSSQLHENPYEAKP